MMQSIPKFKRLLVENFTWLIKQLEVFDDPNHTYKGYGLPDKRGGDRRIYRHENHFDQYYQNATVQIIPPTVDVTFGGVGIQCEQWHVSHPEFSDPTLREKYPTPVNGHYTVLVTSRNSIKGSTASRYYVSCNCMDFDTTFKEELIRCGYTTGTVPARKNLKKKLAPAICKHIYAVLMKEYQDIIKSEAGPEESAEFYHPDAYRAAYSEYDMSDIEPVLTQKTDKIDKAPKKARKTDAEKKIEYEKVIRRSLKFFSNSMRDAIESYHSTRQTDIAFKKYKFMVKKYFQGYVIVFTNPQLNPMRDKVREKEIVPVLNRTAKGMMPISDSIVVYTKFFSKEELMDMIRSESRPIQQNQIDHLNKLYKKYTLTEAIEYTAPLGVRSMITEIF